MYLPNELYHVLPLRLPCEEVDISVVAPAFNEEEGIHVFVEKVCEQLELTGLAWELIIVDDGSRDGTVETLVKLRELESRLKILRFSRNFGNQAAITAGLRFSSGRAVITMDSDLQHPPELIPQMIRHWQAGYHHVFTTRRYGAEIGMMKRGASACYAKTLNRLSDLDMPDGLSDFRLLDRKMVDQINAMPESSRFLRAMIHWLGFQEVGLSFTAPPRYAGESKFSPLKLLRLSADGIFSFSTSPLRFITYTGIFVAITSLLYAVYVLYETFVMGITTPGWPTLVIAVMFLGAIQLISLGVVGEYVGRIYKETKQRPLFIVQDAYGFHQAEDAAAEEQPAQTPWDKHHAA